MVGPLTMRPLARNVGGIGAGAGEARDGMGTLPLSRCAGRCRPTGMGAAHGAWVRYWRAGQG